MTNFSVSGFCQTPLVQDPNVEIYQLENGLNVLLLPRKKSGVELRLVVHSGSLQETEKQLGLAHFVEHMAFKGTERFPDKSSFKTLEEYGINLGSHINAMTSFNSTVYRLSLPGDSVEQLQLGLTVLSEWAYHISFNEEAFESERQVIIEEWRLRQGVSYRINTMLDDLRYHGSLYAQRAPIGSLDIIRNSPIDEVKSYYKQWYQPQRMSLVVVGDFTPQEVKQHINALFAKQPRGDSPVNIPELRQFESQSAPLVKTIFDAEQGMRIIQLALQQNLRDPLNSATGIEFDIIDSVWLTLLNQRLALLTDNQLLPTSRVNAPGTLFDERRLQYLIFSQPKNDDYIGVFNSLFTELQRLATSSVDAAELDQIKQQMLDKLKQQTENEANYKNDYLADQIVTGLENKLPIQTKTQQSQITETILNNLTADKLQKAVAQRLEASDLRIAIIGPDSDSEAVNKDEIIQLWRSVRASQLGVFTHKKQEIELDIKPPKAGSIIKQTELPEINGYEWLLSNGVRVIVYPNKKLTDNVKILLRMPGGLSLDSGEQLGEMRWAQQLVESSGYGEFNAAQLRQFSKQKRVEVRPYAELLYHGLQGSAAEDRLDVLFKLFYFQLTAPNFDAQKLEEMKKHFKLSYSKQPVERQFLDLINQNAFENGERLLVTPDGAWNDFTLEQLKQRYLESFALAQPTTLIIAGNFNPDRVKTLVEQWIASIAGSSDNVSWVNNNITPLNQPMKHAYPMATSDKAMTSMLYSLDYSWSLRDRLAMELLDRAVNLRLRHQVREQVSGVYAIIFSQQLIKHPTSYYLARLNFTTAPDRIMELTQLADEVIQKTAQNGITQEELEQAQKAWLIEHKERQSTSTYWVNALAQTATDDNRFDELMTQEEMIKKMSLADVNALANATMGKNLKQFVLLPKS